MPDNKLIQSQLIELECMGNCERGAQLKDLLTNQNKIK